MFYINILACNSACKTCSGPSSNECTSCSNEASYKLNILYNTNHGSCGPKVADPTYISIDLYVDNQRDDYDGINVQDSGNVNFMFSFDDALRRAYALQEHYYNADIIINVYKGYHSISRSNRTIYQKTVEAPTGRFGSITIRPLYCSIYTHNNWK